MPSRPMLRQPAWLATAAPSAASRMGVVTRRMEAAKAALPMTENSSSMRYATSFAPAASAVASLTTILCLVFAKKLSATSSTMMMA